jgi:serine/threonine protein kinase
MSVPTTVDELLGLVRKSGLVSEQRIQEYVGKLEKVGELPTEPREMTDRLIKDGLITNFQAEQYLLGKWRGFTLGKYKLLERVGVGGMGQVFLCEHMFMKRHVAVKVLPPAKADQPAALGRFYREARAAGSISHPNIVRTYDIDQDGNLHFIVMEYVDGPNLLDVVKKFGPLEMGRAVSYIRQVAIGLEYAFRNGIIHRDIKPGNILIDRRGKAQILDMGLARFFNDQTDNLTVKYDDKIVLGTADYVAPEQVACSHSVDTRADVYALGASLYFLLAGHPPFPQGTISQKLLWHRTKEPTPIRQIRSDVPEGLAAIVARMMAKNPKARYQTCGEVAQELEPWLPERVILPADAEMPSLSPAATLATDENFNSDSGAFAMQQTPAQGMLVGAGANGGNGGGNGAGGSGVYGYNGQSNSSVVDLRKSPTTRPLPNPFGVPSSGTVRNPADRDPWSYDTVANNAGQTLNPFGGISSKPFAAVDENTPVLKPENPAAHAGIKATTMFVSPKELDRYKPRSEQKQFWLYAALGLSIAVAFGFVAWKYFLR